MIFVFAFAFACITFGCGTKNVETETEVEEVITTEAVDEDYTAPASDEVVDGDEREETPVVE